MSSDSEPLAGNEIAIVGIACRFAGARDRHEFWANLRGGIESILCYDDAALRAAGVSADLLANPSYVRAGGVLPEVDRFDAGFFGFGPKDAAITDPQHRHFFECAWEALEDAGHPPSRFAGSIGVFAGCGMNSYFVYNLLRNPDILASTGAFLLRHTGNDRDFLPTTLSYKLNLTGPSVAIQTACSTSLVAIHVACQSLLASECDLALAGGVTVIVPPGQGYLYNENEPLSPDGHCRAFDARGAGTVLTSGVGVVALRRLADALESGDPIHAVIRGSAINNDGSRKIGYLAPSVDGQAAVIAEALAVAGVDADEISYVETHGTGTNVGDPIEVAALTQAFRATTERTGYCAIGSNKPNIGHTDTAAGVASVIKVAEALRHGELPQSLHYERANPALDLAHSPFYVNDQLREWKRSNGPRRAGVSSLGVGGTNAHVILEEAPSRASGPARRAFEILPLSAKTSSALDAAAARLATFLREHPEVPLADVAHTLQVGRDAFEHRRVLAARSHEEAADLLERGDSRRVFGARAKSAASGVVFMFPGGGAQYPNMAFELYRTEPVFRTAMDECFALARRHVDFDLRALIYPGEAATPELAAKLAQPTACLPAIFATEWALAKLWRSWGVEPVALTGHSMGEYTAACLAGVITLDDALRIVATRGRLVDSVRTPGRMLSVPLSEAELRTLLPADLDLGVVNGPSLCVVCGDAAAIERFAAELHKREIECRELRVPAAGHCRLLDPVLPEFRRCLDSVRFSPPQLPYVSNLTGTWVRPEDAQNPDYWVRHLREAVRFSDGLATLLEDSSRILLEVGPGQTLASLARQQPNAPRAAIGSLRHPDDAVPDDAFVATAFGRLYASGVDVDWSLRRGDEQRLRVSLPTYAWDHQRYWIDAVESAPRSRGEADELERAAPQDWFWQRVFRHEPLHAVAPAQPLSWLVFADPAGLGAALTAELESLGQRVTLVREGDAFYRISEGEYALAPEAGLEGYVELVRDLEASGRMPDRIAHLWLVTADESARPGSNFFHRNQERGFYSLLHLAQALGAEDAKQPMHVAVVSNGMQRVGDDALRYPEKATVLGPVGVIPQELPDLTLQSIDLEPPDLSKRGRRRAPAFSRELAAELVRDMTPENADRRVAYRSGQRYVERLEPAAMGGARSDAPPLRAGGTYLVTGGLGGLGLLLAEHLARTQRARLVLVARTRLPERSSWQSWLASHGSTDETSRKLRKLLELESLGAELMIESGDAADIVRMREIAARAAERFGEVHGVFHVAGAIDDAPVQAKTQASIEAVFSPKLHGTLVLEQVFPKIDFLALFSSTSSQLGAAGQIDYAAASAFLDAFAQSRTGRSGPRTLSIGWGVWRDVGLAVESYQRLGGGAGSGRPATHPLLGRRISDAADATTFSVTHHGPQHWLLDDHRTRNGDALIPGTGYLEIARGAFAEGTGADAVELSSVFFVAPCIVGAGEDVEVRTLVRPGSDGAHEIEIESRIAGAPEWQLHAQAEAIALATPPPAALDLAALRARLGAAQAEAPPGASLETLHARHLRFGPRWSVLRSMRFGTDEALAELELPEAFAGDLGAMALHPALLDLATGFATPLIRGYAGAQLYAPMSYGRVRVFAPMPRRVVSWVRSRESNDVGREVAVFDVTLCDESGRVLAEVEAFTLRKLEVGAVLARAGTSARAVSGRGADAHAESGRLTEAERIFRKSYELGIRPAEGMDALDRLLAGAAGSHVFVSSVPLPRLVERIRTRERTREGAVVGFTRPELETSYVAPRDEIERTLAGFWQELLGVDRVGIEDDFFELGGHSLIAVRLFAKIKKTWELEYAISVLFEAPNVQKCADLVRGDLGIELGSESPEVRRKERRFRFLVPLQKGAPDRPAFFLVAGMFGNVLNLRHVAQHLGADQTVYAIQAKGLLGDDEPHRRFPDMARDYLEEVRAVQPDGPYYLGGFSGGGLTAFEMARQLLDQEQDVGILVLLDSLPSETPRLSLSQKLRVHAQRTRREGPGYPFAWLRNRVRWELEKRAARNAPPARDLSPAEFRSAEIERAFLEALAHYPTPTYPGKAALFRPSHDDWFSLGGGLVMNPHNRGQIANHENRFGSHVAGGIEVHEVSGDHDAMVLEPHVRSLAAKLRACLDEAIQAKAGPWRT